MDSLWYKDAVFYEIYLKSFYDSNGDGIGDLDGLTQKLDYLQALGVDTLWLLPVTPSPMRDDGYDVSYHFDIHPHYGTLEAFGKLVQEAHRRGLRVLAELIPNHTSDQHPWFQASRDPNHPEHARYRDWYVWSDTDKPYAQTRVIFLDYEPSNWTYDPLREQFYWHRFFNHQPDLNYDNPEVQKAMMRVIQFWIDQGVDGIRVDAPPYLYEREGTSCENLPETHAYFKRLRAFTDAYAPGVMLLAEANQWPEDVRPYFGDGDEFNMNFHFPLMPRLFMALARADRRPIEEIMARTPALPANCQWGIFLRCHDELTLEMVTEEERRFMWNFYAPEARMRLNQGIRRRLAPLLGNHRQRIEVANSMLLTFIGSPVLYYGDEIGMGDDIALEDRDGVRTPMQWSDDTNAGFSTSSAPLHAPVIASGEFDYHQVNVAAQEHDPNSLLNTIRCLLKLRKQHPAFGRGDLHLLKPDNPAILAYLRCYENEMLFILNNLSEEPQQFHLDLSSWKVTGGEDLISQRAASQDWTGTMLWHLEGYGYRWIKLSDK